MCICANLFCLDTFFSKSASSKKDVTMSILGKKNFFKRFSGSRLTREAPRIETANNKTPSIMINNEVSEKDDH